MPIYRLSRDLVFPPPEEAEPGGLLAVGGDLSPERLLLAYSMGIFPWFEEGTPILWHSPDPRSVLLPSELHVSRRLRRTLARRRFQVSLDTAFGRVIRACAEVPRRRGEGTWITTRMIEAYERLFDLGFAHCAEAWQGEELAGGVYGLSLGGIFFGESMFTRSTDASKVAFATLVRQLRRWSFDLIDCQVHSEHLARLGAEQWRRRRFVAALEETLRKETRRGRWRLDLDDGDPDGDVP
jgi:leucyl/phenylalanyl-tRNA--protein transferase